MSYACARVPSGPLADDWDLLVVPWPQPNAVLVSPVFEALEDAQRFFLEAPPVRRT